jgi:hypothetical protein
MVTPDLVACESRQADPVRLGELRRAWLLAYAAIWVLTLLSARLLAANPAELDHLVRHVLGATLDPQHNPPPSIGHVLILLAHNLPIASWPLLLGVLGVHRNHHTRQAADTLVAAVLLSNVLTVGAALGVYGAPLLPYIPQVPLEWAALALGASAWLMQRTKPLTGGQGVALFVVIAGAVACAAVLETVAVPHR